MNAARTSSTYVLDSPSEFSNITGSSHKTDKSLPKRSNVHDEVYELDKRFEFINNLMNAHLQKTHEHPAKEEQHDSIINCLENCAKELDDLYTYGNELVTNLKVANEKRECIRRKADQARQEELLKHIQDEEKSTLAKFNEIVDRWSELDAIKEPMALYESLEDQKKRISSLMEQKDNIIKKCQHELDNLNEEYSVEQARHEMDICCMVERIDNQIELMKESYQNNIDILMDIIKEERQLSVLKMTEEAEEIFNTVNQTEDTRNKIKKERLEFYAKELKRLAQQQDEVTRATRIRLEKDADMLQLELCQTRNNVLMNAEKLDYNYNVLEKRHYENSIIHNQQKRRISKLAEHITNMRRKISETKQQHAAQKRKLTLDIEKIHEQINNLELKSKSQRRVQEKEVRKNENQILLVFPLDRIWI